MEKWRYYEGYARFTTRQPRKQTIAKGKSVA